MGIFLIIVGLCVAVNVSDGQTEREQWMLLAIAGSLVLIGALLHGMSMIADAITRAARKK